MSASESEILPRLEVLHGRHDIRPVLFIQLTVWSTDIYVPGLAHIQSLYKRQRHVSECLSIILFLVILSQFSMDISRIHYAHTDDTTQTCVKYVNGA